jgi:PAS domain S-box-containing protein
MRTDSKASHSAATGIQAVLDIPSDFEIRRRQFYLKEDIKYARLGLILAAIPLVAFIHNDYMFFGTSDLFIMLFSSRLAFFAAAVFVFAYIGRMSDYRSYDRVVFSWSMLGMCLITFIDATRPSNFLFHVIIVIMIIFLLYLVVTYRRSYQVISTLAFTFSEIILLTASITLVPATSFFTAAFSLTLANVIGFLGSKEMRSYRINAFRMTEALEANERRYREFSDTLPEIVYEADSEARPTFINKKACEILGYTEDELKGMTVLQIVAPEDRQRSTERFQSLIRGDGNLARLKSTEYSIVRKDGTKVPIMSFIERTVDMRGAPVIRGIQVDVSELKAAEQKLETLNEKLRVVGKLTRHDVRNKLSVVLDSAYLAKEGAAAVPDAVARIERIETTVDKIVRILDFSAAYEKVGMEALSCTDSGKFFDEAVSLHPAMHNINVVNECGGVLVMADSLLRQVFYNLIDNSLKYGKTLTQIRLYCKSAGGFKRLIYEDNGVGISASDRANLFEEGYGKGTGFGLYLIRKICTSYGWTITEEGAPGKGVRFVMATTCPDPC